MSTHEDDITPMSDGRFKVRAERTLGGQAGTGEALVREQSGLHRGLAGARAWMALATAQAAAGDSGAAIAAAKGGLDELGQGYFARSLGVIDDTSLHIDLAEDQIERGQAADAARRLIQALQERLELYSQAHAHTLAE